MTEELSPEAMNEVLELIYRERKIAACKRYRELRGVSLLEAKQFVGELTAELKDKEPERFERSQGNGCVSVGVLLLVLATVVWWAL